MQNETKYSIIPKHLEFARYQTTFNLKYHGNILETPFGSEIGSENDRILQQILREAYLKKELDFTTPTAAAIFSYQKDCIEKGRDHLGKYIERIINHDSFLLRKEIKKYEGSEGNINQMLDFLSINEQSFNFVISNITTTIRIFNNYMMEKNIPLHKQNTDTSDDITTFLKEKYLKMSPGYKAAVSILSISHNSGIILPYFLINKIISPCEYTNALFATKLPYISDLEKETSLERIARDMFHIQQFEPDWNDFSNSFSKISEQAQTACEYVMYLYEENKPESDLKKLIAEGESYKLEFKSSLRWNIKANRKGAEIEHANLKTIAAFLNSGGGTLLVGVNDDGEPLGLDLDQFENDDKMLLHFWNLVKSSMGQDVTPFIKVSINELDGKKILKVDSNPSARPVFLDFKKFGEEFFIRVGPSSASLGISESLKYINDRFHKEG